MTSENYAKEQGSPSASAGGGGEAATLDAATSRLMQKLEMDVECARRYHAYRRNFFDGLHKGTMFLILALGSVAVTKLVSDWVPVEYLAGIAGALAAIDMVFSYSHQARDHESYYRRFAELSVEFPTHDHTHENVRRWIARYRTIAAEHAMIFRALKALCYNQVIIARYTDKETLDAFWIDMNPFQRWLANLIKFKTSDIRTRGQKQSDQHSRTAPAVTG